jgi:hypothetical protein
MCLAEGVALQITLSQKKFTDELNSPRWIQLIIALSVYHTASLEVLLLSIDKD